MRIGIDVRNIGKKRTGDEVVFFNYVKNLALIDSENEYLLFTDIADEDALGEIKKDLGIENKNNFKIISLSLSLRAKRSNLEDLGKGLPRRYAPRNDRLFGNKFIWNLWTLPRYLKKNPIDVYHTQYILPFFVPKSIKLITTIHDISFNFYPQFIKWTDLFFLKLLIPWSLKRADKIVAVSEFTKNEIIKYYEIAPEKIEVAYNAVGENFSVLDSSVSSASAEFTRNDNLGIIRKKYSLPGKFILYLGTMQPRKNLPILIEAYANLKEKLSGTKLVLAGKRNTHNEDDRIIMSIKKFNLEKDVVFTGYIDEKDKPAVFKAAQLFVFPSLYEGFGIPIIEAMSQGTPTLVSDIPVHKEVAQIAAIYFDPQSLADLKEKLYNAIIQENLRKKIIDLGKERVQFFSWEKTAQNLLKIYKPLNK
jgi:glycosyltransferase involved in cell wall biosynthesis